MGAVLLVVAACSGEAVVPTTTSSTTTTVVVETTFTLPGEETESTFRPGDLVGVVGVDDSVTHWLVDFPGLDGVAREVQPTDTRLEALGIAWQVDDVLWERLAFAGREGFFPRSMLAFIGEPDDVTDLYATLNSESVEDLGAQIAGEIEATEIVLVAEPSPLEVVYDVIGLGDDSVEGYRVRVIAKEVAAGFTVELVERTPLCRRGLGDSGQCL
ncbi:MAG TPA: hypothetical protein VMS99_09260 [Acidimicrobiia bacterium]|nr:hypothetical protein [Acidimicrobiia bacterium]